MPAVTLTKLTADGLILDTKQPITRAAYPEAETINLTTSKEVLYNIEDYLFNTNTLGHAVFWRKISSS